jgi:tRNA A37 threonylcarbamoyladenosine synthetase subunit TsaC/SUA5/YrdC
MKRSLKNLFLAVVAALSLLVAYGLTQQTLAQQTTMAHSPGALTLLTNSW